MPEGIENTPSETQALEDLAKVSHDLTAAVTELRENKLDRETVAKMVEDQLEKRAVADRATNAQRRGYSPDDVEAGDAKRLTGSLEQRMSLLHERSAEFGARATGRPVADVREFQNRGDHLLLLATAMDTDPRETSYFTQEYLPAMRAMDTATAAEGQEFVPKALSSDLIDRIQLELRVPALFPLIQMPTQPYDIPGKALSRQKTSTAAEQTADTGQTLFTKLTPGSRKVTLTAKKFAAEALVSKEAEEDSIIPMLPLMQEELIDFLAADLEDAIINGDTAGTQDTGWASLDPRKAWDGLRKVTVAGAKSDASAAAALTLAMLRTNRKNMGKYGVDPNKLAHILSINAYIQLLGDTNVQTLEKYGPNATVLQGELAKADGIPVIVSEYVRTDLNATGVFDNVTTTRTEAITVRRDGFIRGSRRGLTLQKLVEVYAEADQDALVVTLRQAFAPRYTTASEKIVSLTYNITS